MPYDVFISYASPDLAFAEQLHRQLLDAGFSVWFDKARLEPGCQWHHEIEEGCEDSRIVLPVLTPRWKLSEWTRFETYGAEAVIPLLFAGTFNEVFTPPLTRFQSQVIDLGQASQADWDKLFAAIRGLLAQPAPDKLDRLANLRYHSNPYFVGRDQDLLRIHEELHQTPTAVLTQGRVRALAALGGIGKTTLARHYVEKFWRLYPQVFWIDARLGYELEFAGIFDILFPEEAGSGIKDPEKAARALRELNRRHERLLVIDNVEDEVSVQAWIPKAGSCRTLITSRFAGWSAAIKSIHLYVLEQGPACTLLCERAGRLLNDLAPAEAKACANLAEKLGYLPLALEQAAAYIAEQGEGFGFADYLRLYEQATAELLDQRALGSTEYPDSVITTWKATIARLPSDARAILRLAAFLADTPIPLSLLQKAWHEVRACADTEEQTAEKSASSEITVRNAAASLKRFSMARFDGTALQFHNLVQTIERIQMNDSDQDRISRSAESLIARSSPVVFQNYEHWNHWRTVLPHLRQLRTHAQHAGRDIDHELITGMVLYHLSQGSYVAALADAEAAYQEAIKAGGSLAGATEANNMAVALVQLGRHQEALPWHDKALDVAIKAVSKDHGLSLKFLATKALSLHFLGRNREAIPLLEELVPKLEAISWFDKKDILMYKAHLATANERVGNSSAAIAISREAADYASQNLGDRHPISLECYGTLVDILSRHGDLDEADRLIRRTIDTANEVLGPDHTATLNLKSFLGNVLYQQEKYAEADECYRQLIGAYERELGVDHTRTLAAVSVLGLVKSHLNQLSESEAMQRRAIIGFERDLGEEHTNTLSSKACLALVLAEQGETDEAEKLLRHVIAVCDRVLGEDNPRTMNNVTHLYNLLSKQPDLGPAIECGRRLWKSHERVYGPDEDRTNDVLVNLATRLQEHGDLQEAEQLYRQFNASRARTAGPADPSRLVIVRRVAEICKNDGRRAEGLALLLEAVELSKDPDHPETLAAVGALAGQLYEQGDFQQAADLDRRVAESRERTVPENVRLVAGSWFDYALTLRQLGNFSESEKNIRHALDIAHKSPTEFPDDSPYLIHWRINLATLLIVQDKIPEALGLVEDCLTRWHEHQDIFVARLLVFHFIIDRLLGKPGTSHLARLKPMLASGPLPVPKGFRADWRILTILAALRPLLPDDADLISALLETLSNPSDLSALDHFPQWRDASE